MCGDLNGFSDLVNDGYRVLKTPNITLEMMVSAFLATIIHFLPF
jgi:hypothetical protein